MKQSEEYEEWMLRWHAKLSEILKRDGDLQLELEAWELLNPPPKLTKEQEVKITIPKMNEED